jgi:hypothetical protein
MNIYQIKGREMDFAYLVHSDDDIDFAGQNDRDRMERVHFVALSRARSVATLLLNPAPNSLLDSVRRIADITYLIGSDNQARPGPRRDDGFA